MEIASLILNAILGSGIIGMMFFYRAKRKKRTSRHRLGSHMRILNLATRPK